MTNNHEHVDAVLPWYVNGTLSVEESEEVRAHVASCVTCRRELGQLQETSTIVETASSPRFDPELGLHRMPHRSGRSERRTLRIPRGPIRWLLLAETGALLLLTALFVSERAAGPVEQPEFRTLASPAAAPSPRAPRARVLFSEDMAEQQIRGLLHEMDGRIVDGPSALGLYTIELAILPKDRAALDQWVGALRSHEGVRFAEAVSTGESP